MTSKKEEEKIKLDNVTKLIFKIDSQEATSRWAFSVGIE